MRFPKSDQTTPLARVPVYHTRVMFLGVLADNPGESFSTDRLVDHAGTATSTSTNHRDDLLKAELVDETKTEGAYPEYTFASPAHAQLYRRLFEESNASLHEPNDPLLNAIGVLPDENT